MLDLVIAKYALEGPWQGREENNLVTRPRTQGSRVKKNKEYLVYTTPPARSEEATFQNNKTVQTI